MPLADSSTFATALPGGARRRAWAHPELRSHALMVLTFDRLYAAPLPGAPGPQALAAVEAGDDLDALCGPLAVVIDLISVRRVRLDLLSNALAVEYAKGGLGTARLTVVFADPEAADACYTKLWRRLGDGFTLQPDARDAWSAARAPLALLIGALLATAALALVLSVIEDTASARAAAARAAPGGPKAVAKPLPEALLGWMDWRAVCAAGGAAAAVAQVWLYRRVTRPPATLELVRT